MRREPAIVYYKPQGVPLRLLEEVEITHEEWEALRLKHVEGLEQIDAAAQMKTSQSTLQRLLASAQKKVGRAIVQGMAIRIVK